MGRTFLECNDFDFRSVPDMKIVANGNFPIRLNRNMNIVDSAFCQISGYSSNLSDVI